MPTSAQPGGASSRAPQPRSSRLPAKPPPRDRVPVSGDQLTYRKVRIVASGSVGAGFCSSAVHYFGEVPADLADRLQLGALICFLAAGAYLVQLLLPREFKVTFEWRRK